MGFFGRKSLRLFFWLLVTLVLFCTTIISVTADSKGTPVTKIDEFVKKQMADSHIPGLALGIVQGEKVILLKGYGNADPTGRVVTPQTPFVIASVSKSITALAAIQLTEAGKIGLDQPVRRYLAWFKGAEQEVAGKMTVRQLLNQTSGISRYTGNMLSGENGDKPLEQLARELSSVKLTTPPGAAYQYSNANYVLLAAIIQTVSGESYADYIQKHVFNPLDMRNSAVANLLTYKGAIAQGYQSWYGFSVPSRTYNLTPCLSNISSAEDMTHYLMAILNGGRYHNDSICTPAGIKELQKPATPITDNTGYGMGWMTDNTDGIRRIKHSGDAPSYNANIAILPKVRYGIILLENTNWMGMQGETNSIITGIERLLVGQEPGSSGIGSMGTIYMVFNLVYLVMAMFLARSIFTFRGWRNRIIQDSQARLFRRLIPVFCINYCFSIGFLTFFPRFFAANWAMGLLNAPDLSYTFIALFSISIVIGLAKTLVVVVQLRNRERLSLPS